MACLFSASGGMGCGQVGGCGRLRGPQPGEGHTSAGCGCHALILFRGPFVRRVLRLPCLLLISQGFRFLFLRYSPGRRSRARKLAPDVSAGLAATQLSFILGGNEKSRQHIATTGGAQHSAVSGGGGAGEGSAGSRRIFISRWRERSSIRFNGQKAA